MCASCRALDGHHVWDAGAADGAMAEVGVRLLGAGLAGAIDRLKVL